MSECSSCHAEILWAIVEKSGKRIPLDPEPTFLGNLAIIDPNASTINVEYVMAGGGLFEERPLYVSHFVTCPHADQHRRAQVVRRPKR